MGVTFTPPRLDFGSDFVGAVGPNFDPANDDPNQLGRANLWAAPAGTITASIQGLNPANFKVVSVTVYKILGGFRHYLVEGRSDGITPLPVSAGQVVSIQVEYSLTNATGSLSATLEVQSSTPAWTADPIPLTVSVIPVRKIETTFGTDHVTIVPGGQGDVPITVTNITGPPTRITYSLPQGWAPSTSLNGVPIQSGLVMDDCVVSTFQVGVPQPSPSPLHFALPTNTVPPGRYGFNIAMWAFGGVPPNDNNPVHPGLWLIVANALPSVAFVNPAGIAVQQELVVSVTVPVIVTAAMSSVNWVNIEFTASGLPNGVTMPPVHDTLSDNPNSLPGMPPHNVDANGSRIVNLTLNFNPTAPTGNIQLTVNWSAALLDINGGTTPDGAGSISTNIFVSAPWMPATSFALRKDPNTWHAGHVNDVLALPGTPLVLLASDTGGVWLATPTLGIATPPPVPLSDSWTSPAPNMRSLALGPEGVPHVYAAGSAGALYETRMESSDPLFNWTPIGQPLNTGDIHRVVVVASLRKLVLASDNGVFWSDIPLSGHSYAFQLATGIPPGACLGLALGPNDTIVASPTGSPNPPASNSNGMYVGKWQPDASGHMQLGMTRALHSVGIDFTKWNNAVVAGNGNTMYAAVSNIVPVPGHPNEQPIDAPYAVLISQDGGYAWKPCGPHGLVAESVNFSPPGGDIPGGTQGGYNICIAVSPADPNTMALGWRGGPWIGRNTPSAFTWEEHGDDSSAHGGSSHLHSDVHAVYFDPRDTSGRTMYVATDGGVALTRDLCQSWDSSINHQLLDLQFWGGSASPVTPGLVVGTLQDNGVVYAGAGPNADSWLRIGAEEDGVIALLVHTDTLLWCTNSVNQAIQAVQWNGTKFNPDRTVGVQTQKPNTPPLPSLDGTQAFVEVVARPASWHRPGGNQRMFAVAVYSPSAPRQDVWGYFSDDDGANGAWYYVATLVFDPNDTHKIAAISRDANGVVTVTTTIAHGLSSGSQVSISGVVLPDSSFNGQFQVISTPSPTAFTYNQTGKQESTTAGSGYAGDAISNIGCDDGSTAYIGTQQGRIYALDIQSALHNSPGVQFKLGVGPGGWPTAAVQQFCSLPGGPAFARYPNKILRLNSLQWEQILEIKPDPAGPAGEVSFNGMAIDNVTRTLFVATEFGVWASYDLGDHWLSISQGLPKCPHSSALRYVQDAAGDRYLYLTTFGRSAYRSRLSQIRLLP